MSQSTDWQKLAKVVCKIVGNAWASGEYGRKLLSNPQGVLEDALKEADIPTTGIIAKVDTSASTWKIEPVAIASGNVILTIPFPPKPADVSDEELKGWCEGDSNQYPSCLPNC